jgi:hypothetical protein
MVGTPPDAFASDASAHPTNSSSLVTTLPPRGKSAEIFLLIHGSRVYSRPPRVQREKHAALPQEKLHQHFASSLPQDSSVQLMFGAARFDDLALSASRSFGFRARLRGGRAATLRLCCTSASMNEVFQIERSRSLRDAA